MPDLADGESIEVQGSGAKPYVLKNVGGVYSCSCPAWRNQSVGIERRTCKHLRKLRGDAAEEQRIGDDLPAPPKTMKASAAPPLLLAETWDGAMDLTGWWLSEKLDGVRAYWDGERFVSRQGNTFHAPDWFVSGLPKFALDGELWIARKSFQRTVSIARRQDRSDHWKEMTYVVFDAPGLDKPFEDRLAMVKECFQGGAHRHATAHVHERCRGADHLSAELARITAADGEGLMLRRPGSRYEAGRSTTLLKVKKFLDGEARVLKHLEGAGRHKGRLGALMVELEDGTTFQVGTGFSDAERDQPPPLGCTIAFRYQELSDRGVPRFPSYVGLRAEQPSSAAASALAAKAKKKAGPAVAVPAPAAATTAAPAAAVANAKAAPARRFEFADGKSNKFWSIAVDGCDVTVCFGRVGTSGQTQVKSFPDAAAAGKQAQRLIEEKTKKGYVEA
jgi:DNA ligase 1